MTSHQVAEALIHLGKTLKKGPDVPLHFITFGTGRQDQMFFDSGRFRPEQAGAALSVLSALANVNKRDWQKLIEYYAWPIRFNPRDSSRNVLGKVLTFLQEHPEARKRLKQTSAPSTSPQLMNALKVLLGES